MKIISGRFGNRKIRVPKTVLRPTTDKVKEALFSILVDKVKRKVCLDLFCGSGALGLEALSRGADKVFFVDEALGCLKALETTLGTLGFERIKNADMKKSVDLNSRMDHVNIRTFGLPEPGLKAVLIKTGFSSSIRLLAQQDIKVDMIFADPPYYKDKNNSHLSQKCLNNIAEYKILKDSSMVILEHYAQDKISIPAGLVLFKQKEYGDTTISFCKNKKILAIINTL